MSLFMGMNRIMAEISVAAARHGKATPAIDRYLSHQCSEEHFTDLFAEKPEMKSQENPQDNNDNKASVIFPEVEAEKVLDKAVKVLEEAAAEVATQQATKNDPKTIVVDDNDNDEPTEMEILLKPTKSYPAKPKNKNKNKNKAAAAAKEAAKKVG